MIAPLRIRDFRMLMTAFVISRAGAWIYNVGLTVYVYERTHSAVWVGVATIGRYVPSLILGWYGGVIADRFERVRLLATLDLLCSALMAGLTLVAVLHGPVLLAILIAGATKVCSTAYEPAVTALTPLIVPERQLVTANALRTAVERVAIVVGSAGGGLLLLVGPTWIGFAANATSFVLSATIVSRLRVRSTPPPRAILEHTRAMQEIRVGISAISSSSAATLLVVYGVLANFVFGVDTIQLVVLSQDRLGMGSDGYGYLLAGLGLGGVLGAATINRISAWPRLGLLLLVAMLVYCVPTLVFVWVTDARVAFAVEGLRGIGALVVGVLTITAIQRSLAPELLARVFGVSYTVMLLAITVAAVALPLILRAAGLDATLWLVGVGVPIACFAGVPWLAAMDRDNVARLAALAPRIELLRRAGILADVSRVVLEWLARGANEVRAEPGATVIAQGDPADAFYVVASGELSVASRRADGVEVNHPDLGPGDYFGEIGLIQQSPRTATVIAHTECVLLRIEGDAFLQALTGSLVSASVIESGRLRLARSEIAPRAEDRPRDRLLVDRAAAPRERRVVPMLEEARAIERIAERLSTRFSAVPPDVIADVVRESHRGFEGSRVRDHVPALVERAASERLRHETPSDDQ